MLGRHKLPVTVPLQYGPYGLLRCLQLRHFSPKAVCCVCVCASRRAVIFGVIALYVLIRTAMLLVTYYRTKSFGARAQQVAVRRPHRSLCLRFRDVDAVCVRRDGAAIGRGSVLCRR